MRQVHATVALGTSQIACDAAESPDLVTCRLGLCSVMSREYFYSWWNVAEWVRNLQQIFLRWFALRTKECRKTILV
jgi:hypothetical protein